ncbi:binding-protein-dependent transport systems inner membrane component [Ferrimonas balearica DSM 9799]|uniref:Binding-protein-dependent transport systems inner membrane component n=1 Tax=Ferrimonas balearica (strain DSM 9799 / CCM 4581 / KCTC 23876 / PAT) TaxID=550540 RepID=E1SWB5_FERBD|nr:spermidine/putrescine ABC transporter permease PotB [Ferrimonas balearica]ADN75404.1 binding-protein-dependent transport systems inner membrane component [Ferrimonas balearica DSM 9799]MBW3138318.1 spermidine/putrescine ABC transporter permease PotB [Ferrimonas balearica]MBW3164133.1 spermidine/putrescine ABC transporter permease PotB [Ferrimonas balearica]MBY5979061.1 spermidine/putrescine ABC transporter permease PotB [Ferrimonas balearica]MBY6105379.1 spermidine/putrescine ABC transporte
MSQFVRFRPLVITLTLSWLAVFVLAPHLLVLVTSFLTPDQEHLAVFPVTLDNLRKLWNPVYLGVLWDSLVLSFYATVGCLLIGYPFAYIVAKLPRPQRMLVLFLMIVPFWTNSLIRTYAFKIILGNKGLVNSFLEFIGLIDSPLPLLYTQLAVILGLVYILLPFMILPLISSFENLDDSLLEAGRDLGAGPVRRFWHIVLPMTSPGIVAGCLLVFLPAMGMFYVADLLGGATNLLLGNVIKNQFLVLRDWPFGATISIALILMMGVMLAAYYYANRLIQRQGGLDDSNL